MEFKRAKTFDDLVDANLRFLRRELDSTPFYTGALEDETEMICDLMIAMCSELRAMTTNSQPAYVQELRRQRGYVSLFIRTDKDISTIAEKLYGTDLVCVVSKYTGAQTTNACILWDETIERCNDVSQIRRTPDDTWEGKTFFNPWHSNFSILMELYDTDVYKASLDKSLVYIHAADAGWGYATDHCIKRVHQVLKELFSAA